MQAINLDVYVVTDRSLIDNRSLTEIVEESLKGGAGVIQLREKDATSREFYNLAVEIKAIMEEYPDSSLIINDRIDIALAAKADGVHLGQEDIPVTVARKIMGPEAIIGATVSSVDEAYRAKENGADYLGTIAVFQTPTKEDAAPIGLEGLEQISMTVDLPMVAIGGIKAENAAEAIKHGADGVAVVSEVMCAPDPVSAVKNLLEQVNKARQGEKK